MSQQLAACSGNEIVQNISADIRQLTQAAGVPVTKFVVVQPHQVEDRGMDISNRDALLIDRT